MRAKRKINDKIIDELHFTSFKSRPTLVVFDPDPRPKSAQRIYIPPLETPNEEVLYRIPSWSFALVPRRKLI